MQLTKPEGDMFWVSLLWIGLGCFGAVFYLSGEQPVYLIASSLLLLMGILVWHDVREIALPLIILFGISLILRFVMLFVDGWSFQSFIRACLPGYIMFALHEWRQSGLEREDFGNY